MSIIVKENQKIVTLKTPDDKSIYFKYTMGTKTFEDVLNAIRSEITYEPPFNKNYMDIKYFYSYRDKNKSTLSTILYSLYDLFLLLFHSIVTMLYIKNDQIYKPDNQCEFYHSKHKNLLSQQEQIDALDYCRGDIILVNRMDHISMSEICDRGCCDYNEGDYYYDILNCFVSGTNGLHNYHGLKSYTTVGELRHLIQDREGIPCSDQMLSGGRLFSSNDKHTMLHCGITDGSSISVMIRARGGMYDESSGKNGKYKPLDKYAFYDLDKNEIIDLDLVEL